MVNPFRNQNFPFAPLPEFEKIAAMFPQSRFDSGVLGDDGYAFRVGNRWWAATTDASVEKRHFNLQYTTPGQALEKSILSNLSDLNAMGASCRQMYFSLVAKSGWSKNKFRQLGKVISYLEKKFRFQTVGGDLVSHSGPLLFSLTALGPISKRVLRRSGARVGHRVYLSGPVGMSAAGLHFQNKKGERTAAIRSMLRLHKIPLPPLGLGPVLSGLSGTGAAIDISDGLSSECWHLSRQSKVQIRLDASKIPIHRTLKLLGTNFLRMRWILNGGEDYALLFTGKFTKSELNRISRFGRVYEIGEVHKGMGVHLLRDGGLRLLPPEGWSHS